jgi:hypothetical protein
MFIYINFSFDFLGLDNVELLRQSTHKKGHFSSYFKHSQSVLYQIWDTRLRACHLVFYIW